MRRRIEVRVIDDKVFVVRGWLAHKVALEAGLRPIFSGVYQGWVSDLSKLERLEVHCARRRMPLDVQRPDVEVISTRSAGCELAPSAQDRGAHRGDDQVDVLGDDITKHSDVPLFEWGRS